MEKKTLFTKKPAGTFPYGRLFLAGFLLGTLIPNMIWRMEWHQKTAASVYLLSTFADRALEGKEYFLEVLKMRGSCYLLASLCGISVFGVPFAVIGLVLMGTEIGMLLTLSILQFGLIGGAVGAALLFPQYLLYIPASFYLMTNVYRQSMSIWKARGLLPQRVYLYAGKVLLAGVIIFAGILSETFCNPWVMEIFIKNFNFF